MFKVGDKVKVVRKAFEDEQDDWIAEMDATLGKCGEVIQGKGGRNANFHLVAINEEEYWYHKECLTLLKEKRDLKNELEQEISNLKREIEKREDMLKCIKLMDKHSIKITFVENFKF